MRRRFFRFYYRLIGRPQYATLAPGLLLLNFIVQRLFGVNAAVKTSVHFTNTIKGAPYLRLGAGVDVSLAVSSGLYFTANPDAEITVGDGSIIAPGVKIVTGNHGLVNRNTYSYAPVTVGKNAWLGAGCVLLPGVTLGDNVTVAAGAVVTESFPSNCVIGGVPARILKEVTVTGDTNAQVADQ